MTARAEYTDDEWTLLSMTPFLVGFAVAFSDGGGVIETLRETGALIAAQAASLRAYPDNELVKALSANQQPVRREAGGATAELAGRPGGPAAGYLDEAEESCRKVVLLLSERSHPREAEGYKRYVMDAARAVALAARGGGFLSRGPLVGPAEREALERISRALGVPIGDLPAPEGPHAVDQPPSAAGGPPAPDTVRGKPDIPSGPIRPE